MSSFTTVLAAASLSLVCAALASAKPVTLENAGFRLTVDCAGPQVRATLDDLAGGLRAADGPCMVHAVRQGRLFDGLEGATARVQGRRMTVSGRLAGLELRQTFTLPADRPLMEERITLRNPGRDLVALDDLEIGFLKAAMDAAGRVPPDLAADRWVAVPFRHKATDAPGYANEYSVEALLTSPGWEPRVTADINYSQPPSRHRPSEGWAWLHGTRALCVFRFSQQNMLWSVVSQADVPTGKALRFGGAAMISGEPAALTRMRPGEAVDLGVTRYETVDGGYEQACRAFRDMLDERGCRFPASYNPPVHWEQLYDMEGAWNDRPHNYTKAALEREAAKGQAYSCEALYLDPGWDTGFATFLWGPWLGSRKAFVQEMRDRYGLGLALHCPLATWMSKGWPMGPDAVGSWPAAARRKPPAGGPESKVAAVRGGRRNLALLPAAKAAASSLFEKGSWPIHQIPHLNDGWYGNRASWIAGEMPCWAEIDLGAPHRISEVCLGNDHALEYSDRSATRLRILVATEYAPDSSAASWHEVASLPSGRLAGTQSFSFAPADARWVRIEIAASEGGLPRLDEIEVYEAEPVSAEAAAEFERTAKRGPEPPGGASSPLICQGAVQYRDEAAKRLLANCADGAVFLMFDGTWWNGGCDDPHHGHPVPYRWEDHIRANVDLAQRVHAKYPKVLIEMHDMLAGGNPARPTPIYYKYGLPGSYDENWGFELMWDPMADIKANRARTLYEYNLGCNIPVYLHIDLRKDNAECLVLWWYASTCRHLGIGGTHADPAVVAAQKAAMQRYHALERFYKRGEFVGLDEQVHVHTLPKENAFVVNLFNLSDAQREVQAFADLRDLRVDRGLRYEVDGPGASVADGRLQVRQTLPPWSARVVFVRPAASR